MSLFYSQQATLTLPPMPDYNEVIDAAKHVLFRGGKKGEILYTRYTKMKDDWTEKVAKLAIHQCIPRFQKVDLTFIFRVADKRKDPDNIRFGCPKFIIDGLVKAQVIGNDGQKFVGRTDFEKILIDKQRPGIVVVIKEAE